MTDQVRKQEMIQREAPSTHKSQIKQNNKSLQGYNEPRVLRDTATSAMTINACWDAMRALTRDGRRTHKCWN
jgi:hypothetical protein